MELKAHSPSLPYFSIRDTERKETWSHTTFPRSGHFFQPWSKLSTSDPSFDGFNDDSRFFAFVLVLTWAQVSEDKVGAGLAKGYASLPCVVPSDCLALLVFMDSPIFELVVGH